MLKKIVLFALLMLPLGAIAQDKIAYLDSEAVMSVMPEVAQMQDSIQKVQEAFKKEMTIMEDEYSKKFEAYMAEAEGLIESIRTRREGELRDIEQRAQAHQEQFQTDLQQLYRQLLAPIQQKVREAIQTVGAENNFTYVLEASAQAGSQILYVSPTAVDATPLVKQKLGLQ
ncbi:outer membrane protein [Dysgonomonadaceae bacterium PH5-43]|nr:outer membrane protein [Dysgonomonadaceae bacterium PH5-43]